MSPVSPTSPDFELLDHDGKPFTLADVLERHAATVLLPFRGHW
jgi:hypothetical protein